MHAKAYLFVLAFISLPISEGFSQLQDPEHLIFLYMNGVARNQDLAKDAFIINSDGDVLHRWNNGNITSPEGAPGYLTPDGLFLRGVMSPLAKVTDFSVGKWGTLQLVDWDGTVLWEYDSCTDSIECFHHDVALLPNGNILVAAFHRYDEYDAAREFGWNVTGQGKLLIDIIYEIKPNLDDGTSEIVWEWKWIDHVIQDGDPGLPNYGVIADHPEKIDLHYVDSGQSSLPILLGTHTHINSIDYNPERDEILFSSGTHDEIYIIDHSTTIAEAATSSGGNSGKGGDILYRWGNPETYDFGGGDAATYSSWVWTRKQHDARWLMDGTGNITIHNNNSTTDPSPSGLNAWSQFLEVEVPYDNGYPSAGKRPFGPSTPVILAEYDPLNPLFNCTFAGGGQKLDNGHVFTTSASKFTLLEHDETGRIVWHYNLTDLHPDGGQVFKAQKYPVEYSGFSELHALSVEGEKNSISSFVLHQNYPNPFHGQTKIRFEVPAGTDVRLRIFDMYGREIASLIDQRRAEGSHSVNYDGSSLPNGTYFYRLEADHHQITRRMTMLR